MELIYQCCTGEIEKKSYVCFRLYKVGRDWLLTVLGGEEHIGAISISDKTDQVEHHICLPHHKEGDVINSALRELKDLVSTELLILGGVHYKKINKTEIGQIISNCHSLTMRMKNFLKNINN